MYHNSNKIKTQDILRFLREVKLMIQFKICGLEF